MPSPINGIIYLVQKENLRGKKNQPLPAALRQSAINPLEWVIIAL
jgi:hypothetical protein